MPKVKSNKSPVTSSSKSVEDGYVYVEKSVTKSENYKSVRVTVGLTVPINPTEEQLESAKETVSVVCEVLDEKLNSEIEEMLHYLEE